MSPVLTANFFFLLQQFVELIIVTWPRVCRWKSAIYSCSSGDCYCRCAYKISHRKQPHHSHVRVVPYMHRVGDPDNMTRWRHEMETFSALLALCEGNSPATGELPSQRPVTRSFDIFVDLSLNKLLSKQSGRRWFETPSRQLLRHSNEDFCARRRYQGQGQSIISHGICGIWLIVPALDTSYWHTRVCKHER